jgi:hypothetical protein
MKYGISYVCYACKKVCNSKMLGKVFCSPCNIYITKLNFERHLKSKLHELLLYKQQTEATMLNQVSVC